MIKYLKFKKYLDAFEHVEFAKEIKDLANIILKEKTLAIFKRTPPERISNFLQNIDLNRFPSIHTSFYSYESRSNLQRLLVDSCDDKEGLTLFIAELVKTIELFSSITKTELVRFNLQVVQDDMCRYFHSDYNNLRLMCTYAGPGTCWTTNDNVNREKLGSRCNEAILKDTEKIYTLQPFWIGIFKGEVFMNNAGNGIIHRSPIISLTNEKRILLRIDA